MDRQIHEVSSASIQKGGIQDNPESTPRQVRVVLAEDYPVIRLGIKNMLEGKSGITVVGEAADGYEVLRLVEEVLPDVLVLDMELRQLDGVEVARHLKEFANPPKILVLSAYDDCQLVESMLELGVSGYLSKSEAADQIEEAVAKIGAGVTGWLSAGIKEKMEQRAVRIPKAMDRLTGREREVLAMVVDGKSNLMIAYQLGISQKTVEKYLTVVFNKLGVQSRTDAAVAAVRDKLIG
ncbi:MAG: response regulator transcription factor [Anaerolineaceae bacterium]|nr:response regulator transcription factor [Anaerolineaceae bacterium]